MEGKVEGLAELSMTRYTIGAYANYQRIILLKLRIGIAEPARLDLSAAGEVFWIEI